MKQIIKFIIDQEYESLDDYPKLAEPVSEKFEIELETAKEIIDSVIEWETNDDIHNSLEEFLVFKFPDIVTLSAGICDTCSVPKMINTGNGINEPLDPILFCEPMKREILPEPPKDRLTECQFYNHQ